LPEHGEEGRTGKVKAKARELARTSSLTFFCRKERGAPEGEEGDKESFRVVKSDKLEGDSTRDKLRRLLRSGKLDSGMWSWR